MRRLLHWFGNHYRCSPSRCDAAAVICNTLESEWRLAEYEKKKGI